MSVLFRILLISVLCWGVAPYHASAEKTTTILIFGDSIVAGYGLKAEEAPPAQLEEMLTKTHPNVRVINGGVSGDTTSAGRSRLSWTLDRSKPDLVILALGGNDVLRGIPPELTKENIHAMLELLKERKVDTVLSSVQAPDSYGPEFSATFNAIYTDAAKQFNVPLYPFLISETFGNTTLMQADGIHPTAAGAKHIAEDLATYLKSSSGL